MTSVIKVDTIQNTPGTNIINKCSTTITVGAACNSVAVTGNVVKSNALQASDAGNIISQSGTDITLGASGDTIALASGASQTGFGRTGTVDWDTGNIKTATFTAVSGNGYFANTSGGAFEMDLPAGSAGDIVSVVDYTNTFQTNALTLDPNGSEKIGGIAASIALETEGQSVTLVYVDSTEGWKSTMDSTSTVIGKAYVTATGGTPSQSGDFEIRTFTGPGTFCVSAVASEPADNNVDWLVIAGGGGGGSSIGGGGGGAGGYRESPGTANGTYTVSPIAGGSAVTATASGFPITVGGGGAAQPDPLDDGNDSVFSTYTSTGGGSQGATGGSGGGQGHRGGCGGAGNTPSTSPSQGFPGGPAPGPVGWAGAGGGGALAAGGATSGSSSGAGGTGGGGATSSIDGTPTARGGGAGGGAFTQGGGLQPGGAGGAGGGGDGAPSGPGPSGGGCSTVGTANTGGGGGGANYRGDGNQNPASNGGDGVVILRYRYQN